MSADSPEAQDWLDKATQRLALVGFAGLWFMGMLIFYDGAARYLAAPRIAGFSDYGELVFPLVIASCFPAGLWRQSNVSVRVLGTLLGAKANACFESLAAWVTLAFFTVLAWQFVLMTIDYGTAGRSTGTVGMMLAPWWWGTTVIMLLCLPVQALVCLRWTRRAWRLETSHETGGIA